MKFTPHDSSVIAGSHHDPETNTLHLEFPSGKRYRYEGVDAETYQALITAESIGKHFGQLRAKYKGELIS